MTEIKAAKEKRIKDINKDDSRLAISGLIINKSENSLILDDGTSQLKVIFEEPNEFKQGQYIRVIGNLINFNETNELRAEIIQDLNNINKKLHQKVIELLNKD